MRKMSQTEELAKILAARARRHTLTPEQVSRAMDEQDYDVAGLDALYAELEARGIRVAEEEPDVPLLDEALWFHPTSGSLIVTDVLQCWQGPLSLPVRMYLGLTGGHERLTVPRTVRMLVKDKTAVRACARQVCALPVQHVILLHNSVISDKPVQRLCEALSIWD